MIENSRLVATIGDALQMTLDDEAASIELGDPERDKPLIQAIGKLKVILIRADKVAWEAARIRLEIERAAT